MTLPHKKAFQTEQYKVADRRIRRAGLQAWIIWNCTIAKGEFKRYQII